MNELEALEQESSDEISLPVPSSQDVGRLLIGAGAAALLVTLLRGQRSLSEWAIPLGLIGLGSGVLLKRRQTNIEAAERSILAELDALDPIARAQVLKAVAEDQISRLPGVGGSE